MKLWFGGDIIILNRRYFKEGGRMSTLKKKNDLQVSYVSANNDEVLKAINESLKQHKEMMKALAK